MCYYDRIKKVKMDGACNRHEEEENYINGFVGIAEGKKTQG
jgi:hypothetical protein